MQFGTSISVLHVRSATADSAVISRPASSVYGLCGSRNFHQFEHRVTVFTANSECKCWSRFSIGVYGNKTVFSLPFLKYWSNVKRVSEKKFYLGSNKSVGVTIFCFAKITNHHFFKCRLGLPVVRKRNGVVTMISIDMYILHDSSLVVCFSNISAYFA